jgi:flavin reductase (DIM6/NTAB) family NADH-FMN oxidoreductase RutF
MQNNDLGQLMKQGMRRLASGVCVLSARIGDQRAFAMTVTSVSSVSDNPPSLLVCVNRQISGHEDLLPQGSLFAINLLSDSQREVSDLCAGRYQDKDRLSLGDWQDDKWLYLSDALASFCCVTDQVVNYGTHAILIGQIEQVKIHKAEVAPLIYANGNYAGLQSLP